MSMLKKHSPFTARQAFTLLELLVVVAIIGLLAGILAPALTKARDSAKDAKCLSQLHMIAQSTYLYTNDNQDQFPRSKMTAKMNNVQQWGYALLPYLGYEGGDGNSPDPNSTFWANFFNSAGPYRCPCDTRTDVTKYSYGLNQILDTTAVDPNLPIDANSTDVFYNPSWHWRGQIPVPAMTVLYAEIAPGAMGDHFMPQMWMKQADAASDLDYLRHTKHSNYAFVDGHSAAMTLSQIYDPNNSVNLCDPGSRKF